MTDCEQRKQDRGCRAEGEPIRRAGAIAPNKANSATPVSSLKCQVSSDRGRNWISQLHTSNLTLRQVTMRNKPNLPAVGTPPPSHNPLLHHSSPNPCPGQSCKTKPNVGKMSVVGIMHNIRRPSHPQRCPNEPRHRTAVPVMTSHKPNHDQPRSGLSAQRESSANDSAQHSVIAAARIMMLSPSIQVPSSAFDGRRVCLSTERYGNPGPILRAWPNQSRSQPQASSHKPEQNHRNL
jgi:hypothetical protein